jgi:hypothetical protein
MTSPIGRLAAAFVALLLLIGGGILTSLYLADRAVHTSDQRWCSTLDLLVIPRPPPSYAKLNHALADLAHQFGCRGGAGRR